MNIFLHFFRGWLGAYFLLVHFVIPFYLVAIYPEVPEPAVRALRGIGYGAISAPASELGFWYRFLSCGAWVLLGLLLLSKRIREIAAEGEARAQRKARKKSRAA
ncbi:hypothetical protein [Curvibacter sp. PAE-UM]|uniref:hypothetical protein n=1 Tax=Curvibacter sp. PAE-UM TaxID=1714344 RepID=UPI0012E33019|nr:hypothetical protein [Curvibacter sp. PAE-UM]